MAEIDPTPAHDQDVYLIHDGTLDLDAVAEAAPDRTIVVLEWDQRLAPPSAARVLLFLSTDQIRELAPVSLERQWEIGILPHDDAGRARRALGVKGDLGDALKHALEVESVAADILTCNDRIVFTSVMVGEALNLRPYDAREIPDRRSYVADVFRSIKNLHLKGYRITVGEDQKINLAAFGFVVLDHTQSKLVGRSFSGTLNIADGRLTMLALAPRSIISFLWFMLRVLMPRKISLARLPDAMGLIRSRRILIEADEELEFSLDGELETAPSLEFRILEERLRVLPGAAMSSDGESSPDKEQIKVKHLPVGETAKQMAGSSLPFFSHASEEEYRDLFSLLRDSSKLTSSYLVLTVLSVLLALSGLYANSAPVIIGAMILAPLMAPIISLAMGIARTQATLIRRSLRTLLVGISAGLGCAIVAAWIMPLENITPEMQARMTPTLLDLSVAVISGIAGAYAHSKEEIAKSLAGVAIAVALVPPLSVAGIGLGWGHWPLAQGALLLFITNLVGIALAASVTFLVLGFAPFKTARKGMSVALLMLALIAVPLGFAFSDLVKQNRVLKLVPRGQVELAGSPVEVRSVSVRVGDETVVRVTLSSPNRLDAKHMDALKKIIADRVGHPVVLEAQFSLRR